jgi:hypothetical protein
MTPARQRAKPARHKIPLSHQGLIEIFSNRSDLSVSMVRPCASCSTRSQPAADGFYFFTSRGLK